VLFIPPSALRVASVALRNPANRHRAVSLTPKEFRYGFGNTLTEEESATLYERWTIPSPGKPLFEGAFATLTPNYAAKVDTSVHDRGPLLLTAGGQDHTVPKSVTTQTVKRYANSPAVTDYKEFPDRGHALTIDHGWRDVADASLAWLQAQSF
jgi:non-heme chloroperoxidase